MTNAYRNLLMAQQHYQAQKENEAREARSLHTIESTGVGEAIEAEPLKFLNPFVFEPSVSYGAEIVTLPDQELWGLPRANGAVLRWDKNGRGFYVGAFVYVVVDLNPAEGVDPVVQPSVRIQHHFSFASLSYKALGDNVTAQVQEAQIEPRAVNL